MKLNRSLLPVALLAGLSVTLAAQGGPPPGPRPTPPLLAALDANHDGSISQEEIDNAPKALATLRSVRQFEWQFE